MLLLSDCAPIARDGSRHVDAGSAGGISCDLAKRDLATARQLQRMLLPPTITTVGGWTATYRFLPAGAVSGDFVDIVPKGDRLYFVLGDVSGKASRLRW
jgi:hypothetical protein